MESGSNGMSTRRILFLLACVCTLSTSFAAPIRMSRAAKRKQNTRQLSMKLASISSRGQERKLKMHKPHPHPHPHPHPRHSHNVTNSCIGYTCSELKCAWNFPGDIPDCPGKSCNWSGGSKSSGCTGDDGDDGTSNDDGTSSGNVTSSVNETSTDDVTNNDDNADYQDGDINDDSVDDAYYTKIEDFDVGNCTSFSNYWLWDLALTCDSSYNLTDCECTSAAILMSKALLTCPDGTDEAPYCPDNCDICNTCLSLLGCSQTKPPGSPLRGNFSMSSFAYILAAIAGVLLGVIAVMVHQKKDTEKPLEENLVDGAMPPAGDGDGNVWLAPVSD